MTDVDFIPRGTLAYDVQRSRLAWQALGFALWDSLPRVVRRAVERALR